MPDMGSVCEQNMRLIRLMSSGLSQLLFNEKDLSKNGDIVALLKNKTKTQGIGVQCIVVY
jgi:hypothetical protein